MPQESASPNRPIRIKPGAISLPNKTVVDSSALLNALVRTPDKAIELLNETGAAVTLKDISVDSHGRVVIDNAEFAKRLAGGMPGIGDDEAMGNGICGLRC